MQRPFNHRGERDGKRVTVRLRAAGVLLTWAVVSMTGFAPARAFSGETLLTDGFLNGKPGQSVESAGWTLNNDRGKSQWTITEQLACEIKHSTVEYCQDSIHRECELPPRFYFDFEAKFSEHAGLSLVAVPGRSATAFHGSGKVVLWKLVPQYVEGRRRGWRTVPQAISVDQWHRFRIVVDAERKVQEYYVDRMDEPTFRETGLDPRLDREGQENPSNFVEFRDYGLSQQPTVTEVRNVKLVALGDEERPPDDSHVSASAAKSSDPTPAQLWRIPGRAASARPSEPLVVDENVQLFVDDYLVAEARNLRRRLHKPVPHPQNPMLTGEKPWENGHLAFPCVHFIDGEFKMWYLAWGLVQPSRAEEVPIADSSFLCYATSQDGVHWEKPALGHIEFQGSRENNIVLRHQGSHFDSFSVFYHPEREYPYTMLAYQGRWPYKQPLINAKGYEFEIAEHGHFPFRSQDGLHWEYIQEEPDRVWGYDRSSAGYDHRRNKYMGFWKTGYKGVRSRMYAESDDLVHWTPAKKSLTPQWIENPDSQVDPPGTHFYGMFAFNYGDQYLGLLEILDDLTARMHLQLISSRDLETWNRLSAPERFIDHGEEGSWNSGILMMANSPPVRFDDKLWFYYDGADYDHSGGERSGKHRSIGVATLPVDRFAGVYPDDRSREATLTTMPLKFARKTLHINAEAANGMVQVELLREDGQVLEGFGRDDCKPLLVQDQLDFPITWKTDRPLPEHPVRIRFVLTEAELFAFRVE